MKLIDLLVKELPKRGGWPNDAKQAWQSSLDGEVYFYGFNDERVRFRPELINLSVSDNPYERIQREEYESAIASSQQPAWSGDGLPPVGCECEVKSGKESWTLCKVVHSSSAGVAFIYLEEPSPELSSKYMGVIDSIPHRHAGDYFRPIRTEADRKREETTKAIMEIVSAGNGISANLYDAIEAGKIPGVKLE